MAANPKTAITPAGGAALAAPVGPIATALQGAGVLDVVTQGKAHLVSPIVAIDSLSEMTRMSVRMVRVDRARETYPIAGGKLGLLKVALDKIAGAAQVDWAFSGQVDDWNDPYRVKYHAIAVVTNPDGTKRRLPGTKVLDLRKTADYTGEDAAGMSDRELAMARKHIHALAESKAKNRAIRSLGIPQAMTPADAELPWVVVALVPNPDHPAIRDAMVASLVPTTALLYGHKVQPPMQALPAEIHAGEEHPDAIDLSDMVEAPEEPPAPAAPAAPAAEPDPWPDAPAPVSEGNILLAGVKIEAISEKKGKTGDKEWTRFGVKIGDDWISTFSDSMAATARSAKSQGASVTVEYAIDEKGYKNLVAITPGTQRDLPLDPPAAAAADPWDAPASCPLPVSEELLARVPVGDEKRMKYLLALNGIFADMVARRGATEAQGIAAKVAAGFDPLAASLEDVARVGAALRAELGGGR